MKQCFSLILCVILFICPICVNAAEAPETGAEAYVLYCADSGEIIAEKNAGKRMNPDAGAGGKGQRGGDVYR